MTTADTIWWHVYPLGATGAPIRNRVEGDADHRLRTLGPWLDYLIELGCNCLLYTSPSPRDATLSRMPSSA